MLETEYLSFGDQLINTIPTEALAHIVARASAGMVFAA